MIINHCLILPFVEMFWLANCWRSSLLYYSMSCWKLFSIVFPPCYVINELYHFYYISSVFVKQQCFDILSNNALWRILAFSDLRTYINIICNHVVTVYCRLVWCLGDVRLYLISPSAGIYISIGYWFGFANAKLISL